MSALSTPRHHGREMLLHDVKVTEDATIAVYICAAGKACNQKVRVYF